MKLSKLPSQTGKVLKFLQACPDAGMMNSRLCQIQGVAELATPKADAYLSLSWHYCHANRRTHGQRTACILQLQTSGLTATSMYLQSLRARHECQALLRMVLLSLEASPGYDLLL